MGRNKIDKDCIYYLENSTGKKDWCSKSDNKCKVGSNYCECSYPVLIENSDDGEEKLKEIRNNTVLSSIIKDDGQIYAKTEKGQNRNLNVDVEVDPEWLPKMLNLEGAGEKYKNIGVNELKFIVNIIKYNNNIIAYKESYDCTNLSTEYIEQRSADLKRRSDVADLLGILKERMVRQTERQLQWQFSDSVANLKFLIDTAKEEIQNSRDDGKRSYLTLTRVTAIRDAVKELNQMMGYTDRTVKINNNVTIIGKEEDLPN